MKKLVLIVFVLKVLSISTFADTQKEKVKSKAVIDLGELEVEGEVRRPQITWIDSQKRLKDQIPLYYEQEFLKIEEELLKPITKAELKKRLIHE